MQRKLVVLFALVLLAFVGLGIRLFLINRDNGQAYTMQVLSQQAYENQTIPFKRGKIMDCKGTVLADSQLVYNVIVDSKQILERTRIWSLRLMPWRDWGSTGAGSGNISPTILHPSITSR